MLEAYRDFSNAPVAYFYGLAFSIMLVVGIAEAIFGWLGKRGLATWQDTLANLTMYLGYFAINLAWFPVLLALYVIVGDHQVFSFTVGGWHLGNNGLWWEWVVLFLLEDLCFYWFHRVNHRCRLFWASHVTHHSSQHYNFSVALRQTWVPFLGIVFWFPLLLIGFDPLMVLTAQMCSLLYQEFLHTQLIPTLGPVGWIFNTPQHHMVHHAANIEYLDKNYGGVLIIWDRIFGSFAANSGNIRYGLTKNIESHSPLTIAFHEFIAMGKAALGARTLRGKLASILGPPGSTTDS